MADIPTGRWHQIREVFEAVYDLPPLERTSKLRETCGNDESLLSEVEALVASYDNVPAVFDASMFPPLSAMISLEAPEDMLGRRVGAFELEGLIAVGGMGSVYRAARADGQFEQIVAIKLLDRGLATRTLARRFQNELQALARLNHPNIAQLLDGGVTEDGNPYLVMEYVEGEPIDAYCERNRLSVRERLQLFRTICDTVHYAHQRLIVHRDIKPGNVMVSRDGVAKLLDFGIAEILDEKPSAGDPPETQTAHRVMTPEYASPEQIRGESVTTATDTYSLGVLLFQLLTGERPYRLTSRVPLDMDRIICESEPRRPSALVRQLLSAKNRGAEPRSSDCATPYRPAGRLSRDVDAIVLKALRKEQENRYASAEQFAEDIDRHLAGLPVVARTPSIAYRGLKFLARHKATAATAAVMVIAFSVAVIGVLRESRIAREQRDVALAAIEQARREADSALVEVRKGERVTGFLRDILTAADPRNATNDLSVRELLNQAAAQVHVRFGADPEVESAIRTAIGQTYLGLERYDEAEEHLQQALAIQQRLHRDDHFDVARSLRNLSEGLCASGDYDGASALSSRALEMHMRLYGENHAEVAQDLQELAAIERKRGDLHRAEELLGRALLIRRNLAGSNN